MGEALKVNRGLRYLNLVSQPLLPAACCRHRESIDARSAARFL
jgi:hypothetical protein